MVVTTGHTDMDTDTGEERRGKLKLNLKLTQRPMLSLVPCLWIWSWTLWIWLWILQAIRRWIQRLWILGLGIYHNRQTIFNDDSSCDIYQFLQSLSLLLCAEDLGCVS